MKASPLKRRLVAEYVKDWIDIEQKQYAKKKYPQSTVEEDNGVLTQRCIDFVTQYLKRAEIQGLNTLQGRQNLAKAASTLFGYCEGAVLCNGELPKPGVPSGEIEYWEGAPAL